MSCILCKSESFEDVYRVRDIRIVRCAGCGLLCTALQPSQGSLREIYGEDYFTGRSEHGVDYIGDPTVREYDRARFGDSLDILELHAPHRGRLLDIGCATGHFMLSARERGWTVAGCELSPEAARFAASRYGLDVRHGPLADAGFEAPFDAITLNHVLEHIPAPDRYLADELPLLMTTGGLLFVEVPNFASIQSRVNGADWADLRPEQHLFHFTPETLSRLLVQSGYQILQIATLPEPYVRILGPLVYLGVKDPIPRPAPHSKKAGTPPARFKGTLTSAARRLARTSSMPIARYYARRLMELRLAVVARHL